VPYNFFIYNKKLSKRIYRIENLEEMCMEILKIVKNLNHSSNYIFDP